MEKYPVKKHKDRADLFGEHPKGDLVQFTILAFYISLWILDSFFLKLNNFLLSKQINGFIGEIFIFRLISFLFFLVLGIYMLKNGLKIVYKEERIPPAVLNTSLFKFTRHPIYFSMILIYFGLFLLSCSLISFFGFIIAFILYDRIANYEEQVLIQEFGELYNKYKAKTKRWFIF